MAQKMSKCFSGNAGSASAEPNAGVIRDRFSKQRAFLLGESVAADLLRANPQKYAHEN